jgi:hypothetical protein
VIIRAGPPSVHALGLAACGAALLGAAAVLPMNAPPLSWFACPFRAATGLPCLACGCTHAFHFMVRLQVREAFFSRPLGALLALVCCAHAVWTLLRLCGLPWAPQLTVTRGMRWGAAVALAANWLFLAVRA